MKGCAENFPSGTNLEAECSCSGLIPWSLEIEGVLSEALSFSESFSEGTGVDASSSLTGVESEDFEVMLVGTQTVPRCLWPDTTF